MSWLRNRKRPSSFAPRVERLEDRAVPAASLAGTSLTVTGNNISITDLGTNNPNVTNAITVVSDGTTQTFSGGVTSITINGQRGRDNVVYTLGGSTEQRAVAPPGSPAFLVTRAQRDVTANLNSSARNSFTLLFLPAQTFVGANYRFTLNGGTSGNNIGVRSDGLTIDSNSALNLLLQGASGNDNITVNLNNTAVSPAINPGFSGETPPPAGSAAPNNGLLAFNTQGVRGNDRLFTNVSLTDDSQGFVSGTVAGGFGNDFVGLIVDVQPPSPAVAILNGFKQSPLILTLFGGPGTNTAICTANVTTGRFQSKLVVL
jgi:hypothetical protein